MLVNCFSKFKLNSLFNILELPFAITRDEWPQKELGLSGKTQSSLLQSLELSLSVIFEFFPQFSIQKSSDLMKKKADQISIEFSNSLSFSFNQKNSTKAKERS